MSIKMDNKSLKTFIKTENDRIMDMLISFDIPDSVDDPNYDDYLLENGENNANKVVNLRNGKAIDELEDRLNIIKNKMKAKKRPMTERAKQKRQAKKLGKNKEIKKILVSAAKSVKNEHQKLDKLNGDENKNDIKPVKLKPVFNEEGKMVFSKFDFASHPGAKIKKSHQNPREILKKLKETNKKLSELKESGEGDKATEMKTDIAWKKAFEKSEGKKVKDDPKLLYKSIKKRKVEKKKSKKQWQERKDKVKTDIDNRQKKRQDNINKRIKDNKTTKLKKMSKKGRVIPGF